MCLEYAVDMIVLFNQGESVGLFAPSQCGQSDLLMVWSKSASVSVLTRICNFLFFMVFSPRERIPREASKNGRLDWACHVSTVSERMPPLEPGYKQPPMRAGDGQMLPKLVIAFSNDVNRGFSEMVQYACLSSKATI